MDISSKSCFYKRKFIKTNVRIGNGQKVYVAKGQFGTAGKLL